MDCSGPVSGVFFRFLGFQRSLGGDEWRAVKSCGGCVRRWQSNQRGIHLRFSLPRQRIIAQGRFLGDFPVTVSELGLLRAGFWDFLDYKSWAQIAQGRFLRFLRLYSAFIWLRAGFPGFKFQCDHRLLRAGLCNRLCIFNHRTLNAFHLTLN